MKKDWNKILAKHFSDHKRPQNRRDFLRFGIISFSATLISNNIAVQLSSMGRALAQSQGTAQLPIPFLVFDMAGGAGLPGNFLVGNKGGSEDLLSSYSMIGWDPKKSGYDSRFGVPMAKADISKVFQGITEEASPEAQANLKMTALCHASDDDTPTNPTSAALLVAKAQAAFGVGGLRINQPLGMTANFSGGNSGIPVEDVNFRAKFVTSIEDITSSVSYGKLFSDLLPNEVVKMNKALQKLSATQMKKLMNSDNNTQMQFFANKSYAELQAIGKTADSFGPRKNEIINAVYGLRGNNQNNPPANEFRNDIAAAIVMHVLKGQSAPGILTLGGCDYHDGSSTTGDGKDLIMGRQIGRAVEAAYRLQKPLMFQLLTDGGVRAVENDRAWAADDRLKSMSVIGYYNPKEAPQQLATQIGHYENGQVVNQEGIFAGAPADSAKRAAYVTAINYLTVNGQEKLVDELSSGLSRVDADKVKAFR